MYLWVVLFLDETFMLNYLPMAFFLENAFVGVVVQWLDYLAVTQEPGVRFPTADKVASDVAPPSGHSIHYT